MSHRLFRLNDKNAMSDTQYTEIRPLAQQRRLLAHRQQRKSLCLAGSIGLLALAGFLVLVDGLTGAALLH